MRKAFTEALNQAAAVNPKVMLLTGDLGFEVFDEFQERYGPRYVNVGVAEAQLMCAAAGLALEGWSPVAYSIASFATGRAYEQIRISVSYPQLPVVIVGGGGGYTYSASGVTHHSAEDLALMSSLPGMTVVAPGDPYEVAQLFPQVLKLPGPSYFRIGRYGEPCYEAETPPVLGKARLLRDGERVAIVTTGDMGATALDALKLLAPEQVFPIVYQMHTVKPLDTEMLAGLAERVSTVIVAEEHLPMGGLAAAVSSWRSESDAQFRLQRVGPPDALALGNLNREDLRRRLGYDAESIAEQCLKAWKTKR